MDITENHLTIQDKGRRRVIDLREIKKVTVHQSSLGHFCDRGELFIQIEGQSAPIIVRRIKHPYEEWKQIKIAVFQKRKGIDK